MDLSLYVITANVPELGRTHLDVACAAVAGGATAVQFRDKGRKRSHLVSLARRVMDVVHGAGALFIINDRPELAKAVGADGVHVGQEDVPARTAREIVGPEAVVGVSATCVEEVAQVDPAVVDYVGVGPIFATPSKEDAASPIGLEGLRAALRVARVPVVVIGGIASANASEVMATGADGIAVISAVAQAPDMIAATRRLRELVGEAKSRRHDVSVEDGKRVGAEGGRA